MKSEISEFEKLDDDVTEEEWRRLIDLLIEFRDQEYWDYMRDDMVFGVELPFAEQRVYCIILGYFGMTYGISAYKGAEGLLAIESMQRGIDEVDIGFQYETVAGLLMDRDDLGKTDYKLLKDLDLRFRGKNNWPAFRTHTRGYFPRHLNKEEVKMMTVVLEQAMTVAEKVKDNIEDYFQREEYYLRVPQKQEGDIVWQDEFAEIDVYNQARAFKVVELKEAMVNRLKNQCEKQDLTLAIDRLNFPDPVQDDKERPYYPDFYLLVDMDNEFILDKELQRPEKSLDAIFSGFINYMLSEQVIPSRFVARREEVANFMHEVCKQLDIELAFEQNNAVLENIEAEMLNFGDLFN